MKSRYSLTLSELQALSPCNAEYERVKPLFGVLGRKRITLAQAFKAGVSLENACWALGKIASNDRLLLAALTEWSLSNAQACHGPDAPAYFTQVVTAVTAVVSLLRRETPATADELESAAWSARSAAESAAESARSAESAARSAARSAAWSARSARSAARSSAESAAWSAWSAWSAAESAAWSAAWSAATKDAQARLIACVAKAERDHAQRDA